MGPDSVRAGIENENVVAEEPRSLAYELGREAGLSSAASGHDRHDPFRALDCARMKAFVAVCKGGEPQHGVQQLTPPPGVGRLGRRAEDGLGVRRDVEDREVREPDSQVALHALANVESTAADLAYGLRIRRWSAPLPIDEALRSKADVHRRVVAYFRGAVAYFRGGHTGQREIRPEGQAKRPIGIHA